MNYKIAVIKGDGIGVEIIDVALRVLTFVGEKTGCTFEFEEVYMGGNAIDLFGVPLPQKTIDVCKTCHAVLLGAVGGPKWDTLPGHLRPEAGLLGLRNALSLYANLRPVKIYPSLKKSSPLKEEIISKGVDIVIVRELTGGIYFGKRGRTENSAYDTEEYSKEEIVRIGKVAFEIAMKRDKKVMSVDKANVLESSRYWREQIIELSKEYPEVELSHMYVDNAAMQLIRDPSQFDVIVTNNIFGDILSDEASMITGSIGMLPSASLNKTNLGLYEPIHGSAPDIAGQNIANPLATILSLSLMLRYSLGLHKQADMIETAVNKVLDKGYRTKDIADGSYVSTDKMAQLVIKNID